MSFRREDSFGPSDYIVETEGEKIDTQQYFTEASFNNNNLSFEDSDSKQLPTNYENLTNCVTIPLNAEKIARRKIIIEMINQHLLSLLKIIKSRHMLIKYKAFFDLKNFSEIKKTNKFKAQMIYDKLISSLRILYKFYNKREHMELLKSFLTWRDTSIYFFKLNKFRSEYELLIQKKFEKEIAILENRLRDKENEIFELKKLLSKQIETDTEILKKIKSFEEREIEFLNNIKKIEDENRILQNEIMSFENKCLGSGETQKSLECKIKEYHSQISSLQEENKEKDYTISLFLREMSELLQAHEKNINLMSMDMDMEENKVSHTITKNSVVSGKSTIKLSNPLINSSNPNTNLGLTSQIYASNNQPTSQNLLGTLRNYNSLIGGSQQNINSSISGGVPIATTKPLFVINSSKLNYSSNPSNGANNYVNQISKSSINYKSSLNNVSVSLNKKK